MGTFESTEKSINSPDLYKGAGLDAERQKGKKSLMVSAF